MALAQEVLIFKLERMAWFAFSRDDLSGCRRPSVLLVPVRLTIKVDKPLGPVARREFN